MGQLRVVYRATGEFMAIAVRDQLEAHGIHSVQLLNEIPMQPGFTFELRPWADILVDEGRFAAARQVVAELEQAVAKSEEPAADWPPTIKVHTTHWLGALWIALLAVRLIVATFGVLFDMFLWEFESPVAFALWPAAEFLLLICLAALNWQMLGHQLRAACIGLLALPVVAAWTIVQLAGWLLRQVIRYGGYERRTR